MTLFISDLHIGNKRCKAEALYNFLWKFEDKSLIFLVGDIIDDHQMKQWPLFHFLALREILEFKKIIYLPGNHDANFRKVFGNYFNNRITICNEYLYQTSDGKEYLVTHGDKYDWLIKYTHFVSESWISRILRLTFEHLHTKITSNNIHYCRTVTKAAKLKNFDGVICGHNHYPDMIMIDGLSYMNCGSWMEEKCSAITEKNGKFNLIYQSSK